jgi:lysyl-tRNA synthetase class 1
MTIHWADKFADKLIERGKDHVIETGTSISGIPHIGNASDVIRGDAIRKALEERGANVEFIWVADDSDPFRKIPKGMESLSEYLGYPVRDIPDPDGCHRNFVEHFTVPFIANLREFGVEPRTYSATELYRNGDLNEETRIALENSDRIIKILNKFRTEPLPRDFVFWSPICERCGRISTTRAREFDGEFNGESEGGKVKYVCQDVELSGGKVEGCGFEGESDIRKGYGKLPWRVEWAARWKHFGVTCEPLGKEHATSGGSFWTSKEICRDIFEFEPPIPVMYEFFTLNGEKISSSRGNVITLGQWLEVCEPEVLKFFMYKKLMKQRDINLSAIPNLVDEYDEAERVYFDLAEGSLKARRRYGLSQVSEPKLLQVPFTLCTTLAQIVPDLDMEKMGGKLSGMGYGGFDNGRLERRLRLAKKWIESYGPEYLRFELIPEGNSREIYDKLDENQRNALGKLADELDNKQSPKELHKRIYDIARSVDLSPGGLFEAIYLVLIGKKKGPKAAGFILTLDKEFVRGRFMPK